MSVFVQPSLRWMAVALVVAVVAGISPDVRAQTVVQGSGTPVQTYVNQAVPVDTREGGSWNRPYKAGELKLTKPEKQQTKDAVLSRPRLPVGQLQAPQIVTPSAPKTSASVMLLQGMKNAIQQSGQNPDVPKSSDAAANTDGSPVPLAPPTLGGKSGKYQPGQEPRDLATNKPVDLTKPAATEAATTTPMSSAPASAAEVPTPKATELDQAPVPLDQMDSKPATAETSTSIFGAAVDDQPAAKPAATANTAETPAPAATPTTASAVSSPAMPTSPASCEPAVTTWTRTCVEAGYPSDFTGGITGETRTECPSGDVRDVWLTNDCAAPSASAAPARTPIATPTPAAAAPATETPVTEIPATKPAPAPVAAETQTWAPVPSETERVDASCGAANGLAVSGKPAGDLCQQGKASEVTGDGPWRWSCKGQQGGMTVSCAAPAAPQKTENNTKSSTASTTPTSIKSPVIEDARCGSADGSGTEVAPIDNLCAKGIPSRVNGGGPWTWACSGTNGGVAVSCSAAKKVDGVCGAANSNGTDGMPQRDLCASGLASAITGEGPWHWTCSGLYGGAADTCTAAPKVNAVCGSASLSGHREEPKDSLCNAGQSSAVEGAGPWHWTCSGNNGGAAVTCNAPVVTDGVCGTSNGSSYAQAPSDGLCTAGHASRVTGTGPWNWTCGGLDGGNTASCTASMTTIEPVASSTGTTATSTSDVACGSASEMAAFGTPKENLCARGTAGNLSGEGPWHWTCSDNAGHSTSCATLTATEGTCGTAANVTIADMPSNNLCASGLPGSVTKDGKGHWTWDCNGSMGASTVSCSAPVGMTAAEIAAAKAAEQARCGSAANRGTTTAPSSDLCDNGKATAVKGKGPWAWSCVGKSGSKTSCEAPKILDATCGSTNGTIQQSAPSTGLCGSGEPTEVTGSGPWLWSCIGAGGGSSVSCSASSQAQTRVDGTCGVAANATMTTAPNVNLCDSGMASTVYGEGPWTWTCSGVNGGIASTCTTSKSMPKAPAPPGPMVNGNCGPANGVAAVDQPEEGLCSSGTVTSISGNGPWNWSCLGTNGGMTVSCTAPLMPPAPIEGVCGAANGITTLTMPRSGLCAAGITSAVSGKGPWTWSCSGTNGGGAVGCVAPVAGKGATATPSLVTPGVDEAPVPKAAPSGLVTPRLPTGPLPPLESGSLPQLKSSKPKKATSKNIVPPAPTAPVVATAPSAPSSIDLSGPGATPGTVPDLPPDAEPLAPPPMRDTLKPLPSVKQSASDQSAAASGRFTLPDDVTTLAFKRESDAITPDTLELVDKLADILQNNAGVRITLTAYADNTNITPREARRLSLSRALAVRDYLTAKGIGSSRIDVRALGANVTSGDADRIDVKVN